MILLYSVLGSVPNYRGLTKNERAKELTDESTRQKLKSSNSDVTPRRLQRKPVIEWSLTASLPVFHFALDLNNTATQFKSMYKSVKEESLEKRIDGRFSCWFSDLVPRRWTRATDWRMRRSARSERTSCNRKCEANAVTARGELSTASYLRPTSALRSISSCGCSSGDSSRLWWPISAGRARSCLLLCAEAFAERTNKHTRDCS